MAIVILRRNSAGIPTRGSTAGVFAGRSLRYIGRIAKLLKRRWHAAAPDFLREGSAVPQVLGPASCVIERTKDRYRFHLLVKSPVGYHVSDDIDACLKEVGSVRGVSVSVDVDAYDLM